MNKAKRSNYCENKTNNFYLAKNINLAENSFIAFQSQHILELAPLNSFLCTFTYEGFYKTVNFGNDDPETLFFFHAIKLVPAVKSGLIFLQALDVRTAFEYDLTFFQNRVSLESATER